MMVKRTSSCIICPQYPWSVRCTHLESKVIFLPLVHTSCVCVQYCNIIWGYFRKLLHAGIILAWVTFEIHALYFHNIHFHKILEIPHTQRLKIFFAPKWTYLSFLLPTNFLKHHYVSVALTIQGIFKMLMKNACY